MTSRVASLRDRIVGGIRSDRYSYTNNDLVGPRSTSNQADRWVATTCGYCSVGCGMLLGVKGNRVVASLGDPAHPVNRGRLCPKGMAEHHSLTAPGRLHSPLLRSPSTGRHDVVSWDVALNATTTKIRALIDAHGTDSVAVISTGQLLTEEFYALGKLVRLGLRLDHYDGNTTLCMSSAASGYKLSFGTDGPPGSYEDFTKADLLILWGANIADNHPLLAPRLTSRTTGEIVVVDPRITKTSTLADRHIALRPRSDIHLLNAILHVLIRDGLVDHEFIRDHTTGFENLARAVESCTPESVAGDVGISAGEIESLALRIGRSSSCTIAWTMGVNHSVQGTETVTLINTLAAITGNLGREGGSPFSITGQCNAMGSREAAFTASMPGYRSWDNREHRVELADRLGCTPEDFPSVRGYSYPQIIDGVLNGTIKGLWIIGTNPVVSFPDHARLVDAFKSLEFLVVQDGFATATTDLADVVLPAAIWGEKEGTYTNSERRVSRARAAVRPPGEARSDFQIILDLAHRLGHGELFAKCQTPEAAFMEWTRISAGRPCDYSAMTYERIDAVGGAQWPFTANSYSAGLREGVARLYGDGVVSTPDGRVALRPVTALPMSEPPDEQFPFLLNTGRTVEHWHTRTKTGGIPALNKLAPNAWIDLHPSDALRLNVKSGETVSVSSRRGRINSITVRTTETVRPGEVFMPFHYENASANHLTAPEFDPISFEPNYKQCAVNVARTANIL